MAPRKRKDIERSLVSKGFRQKDGDHHFFIYHRLVDDKKTSVFTKTSHAESDIGDWLLAQMAKQCRLPRKEFLDLVDCPMGREEYEGRLIGASAVVSAVSPVTLTPEEARRPR